MCWQGLLNAEQGDFEKAFSLLESFNSTELIELIADLEEETKTRIKSLIEQMNRYKNFIEIYLL